MAISSPANTKYYVSSTFASAKTATNVTNANPAVVTSASHGYVDNDELLVATSGWSELANMVVRADQSDTNTFSLIGVNTTNTTFYTADGGDSSTFQKVSSWIEIPNIMTISPSGGDLKTIVVNLLSERTGRVLPDGFNPLTLTFSIAYDTSLANWTTLQDIGRSMTLVAYKSVKANGATTYAYGYFVINEAISQQNGQADSVSAAFLAQGRTHSYTTAV